MRLAALLFVLLNTFIIAQPITIEILNATPSTANMTFRDTPTPSYFYENNMTEAPYFRIKNADTCLTKMQASSSKSIINFVVGTDYLQISNFGPAVRTAFVYLPACRVGAVLESDKRFVNFSNVTCKDTIGGKKIWVTFDTIVTYSHFYYVNLSDDNFAAPHLFNIPPVRSTTAASVLIPASSYSSMNNPVFYVLSSPVNLSGYTDQHEIDAFTARYKKIENYYPLPVELVSFYGSIKNNEVELNWKTAAEIKNLKFEVEISTDKLRWIKAAEVSGQGTSNAPHEYKAILKNDLNKTKYYRLKQIDYDGNFNYSNVIEVTQSIPFDFYIEQNYPNPFNGTSVIKFGTKETSVYKISLYNSLGQKVEDLFSGLVEGGRENKLSIDSKDLGAGVYFYRAWNNQHTITKKLLIIK